MPDFGSLFNAEYHRARFEFIENELDFAQNCLKDSITSLLGGNLARASELLDRAERSHATALDQLAKLPAHMDLRSPRSRAFFLAEDMRELRKKILKQLAQ